MTDTELLQLLRDVEADRVERKASLSDGDKVREAICAFANDMPNHQLPGVIFVGVNDDGSFSNTAITDDLLLNLSHMRGDGNIVPIPSMLVQKRVLDGSEIAVVIVEPADAPPVRFKGRTWIRVGPRRAIATIQEERRLSEKRRGRDLPFEVSSIRQAHIDDLDLDLFTKVYVPSAIAPELVEKNARPVLDQLSAVRFACSEPSDGQLYPTVVGMLTIGKQPRDYISADYIQFRRIDGIELTDPIKDQKEIDGPLAEMLRTLDEVIQVHISVASDVLASAVEIKHPDYPIVSLQQIARNAVMHRSYEGTNAPVRINWFNDRIEILSPGGAYGQVNRANFAKPGITDYRNPFLAAAMKNLGYVQRFGIGIALAKKELLANGNPDLEFQIEESYVLATLRRRA